jgi:hypothetical protein
VAKVNFPEVDFPQNKVIVFRLKGGILDGTEYRSDQPQDPRYNMARFYWVITEGGSVGKFITGNTLKPSGGNLSYAYSVVNKEELPAEVIVSCQFVDIPS